MTTYAYDSSTRTLHATWRCGIGGVARSVARLHERTPDRTGMHLAQALTDLSATAWLSYSDPGLLGEPDREDVLRALRRPHLVEDGLLYREVDRHLENAHAVGRALAAVGSAGVVRAVVADVVAELDAVDRALLGDLDGRARQAVVVARLDASPTQIAAADRLLHAVPMGSEELFDEVDSTAACVAAAHWLQAALDVVATVVDEGDPLDVLESAAEEQGADLGGVCTVLQVLQVGNPPLAVVQNLVRSALQAARGMVLPGDLGPEDDVVDGEPRFTLLDPLRPTRALLSGLVRAVQVCFTVFEERCGEIDEEVARSRFDEAVRAEAGRSAGRLLATSA